MPLGFVFNESGDYVERCHWAAESHALQSNAELVVDSWLAVS